MRKNLFNSYQQGYMKQKNQGKVTIQQGEENGKNKGWSDVLGEKEFLYSGEAKEAVETITWRQAEEICNKNLDTSPALLIKSWHINGDGNWHVTEERTLLSFLDE